MWSNAAEGYIRELKKVAGGEMIKSRSPKHLELEAYIISNATNYLFVLDDEVIDKIMSGETSNIIQFLKFEWYWWFYFRDSVVPFPYDNMVLVRYLGPSINVGSALKSNILKLNVQVVHRST